MDCCFETADGLTVVDFKTDRVFSALEVRQRAEHYRPQLEAYSRALERVLERRWSAGPCISWLQARPWRFEEEGQWEGKSSV